MADVEIGEVNTRVELTDGANERPGELRRIIESILRMQRTELLAQQRRDADDRIRDRSWKSDVKPD